MDDLFQCQANISDAEGKINFKKGTTISQDEYDKLPERFKFRFLKINDRVMALTETDVRRLLFDLRGRVEAIEAKLSKKAAQDK